MAKKTFRFQPYVIPDVEDQRYLDFVVQCAALLNTGEQFMFDMREVEELPVESRSSDPNVQAYSTKIGEGKGIIYSYWGTPQHITEPWEGGGIEITTFGVGEGRSALIRYRIRVDKGNRSYFEVEAEGPDKEVDMIITQFQKQFAPPTDHDIERLKKEMQASLKRMEWGGTQDYAQEVLMWQPDDIDTWQALGSSLILSRQYDDAEKAANRLLELKPDAYAAYMNLGNVWMERQNYDKAIESYAHVMEIAPEESFGPYIVATTYESKGDTQSAIELYKKAASMKKSKGPTDFVELAKEALARLQ
ncbi:MAG: tetratricopeptide repeat protein [Chloroflexia bacterium]